MPKYRFTCETCKTEMQKFAAINQELSCPTCGNTLRREFPSAGSHATTEIVDSFTGVKQEEDAKKKTQSRKTEHFWEVEVPRLVQTYSLQTCLEEGWLVYNDKGELVVGKSPKKR
jgi:putative FmdB family regulatory protein